VTYSLNHPTVSATASASLEISTGASPGTSGTATVTATLNAQQAQFQFLVVPWIQVSNVNVTGTPFVSNPALFDTGSITVENTGTQPIGPTILLAYHSLDPRIDPYTVGGAMSANEVAPTGDPAVQFPDGMLASGQSVSAKVAFYNPFGVAINFTPQVFVVQAATACDISGSGGVAGVQLLINEALGASAAANDLNGDGVVNIVDVQIAIDGALGFGCTT
jgi:hypothetical protein